MAVLVGRSLLAGMVRAVPVVMSGVLAEDGPQVPFTVDEHPVGALGSCAAYPLNLASRSPIRKRKEPIRPPRSNEQITGPLSGPRAVQVGSHAQDVQPPGPHLHDEQHYVQAAQGDCAVDMKEVTSEYG